MPRTVSYTAIVRLSEVQVASHLAVVSDLVREICLRRCHLPGEVRSQGICRLKAWFRRWRTILASLVQMSHAVPCLRRARCTKPYLAIARNLLDSSRKLVDRLRAWYEAFCTTVKTTVDPGNSDEIPFGRGRFSGADRFLEKKCRGSKSVVVRYREATIFTHVTTSLIPSRG
jgi:hypothetical protein